MAQAYHFVQSEHPDFILLGEFARSVDVYPTDVLADGYTLVTTIGGYELYELSE